MMKKTDKQTLDMLRGEFAKSTESVQVPLRLQKDSVVTMLKNSDAKTKDFSSKTGNKRNNVVMIRRFAAAAAVFAVVIIAVILSNQGGVKVIKTDTYNSYNKEKPVMGAMDYNDIVQAVMEIRNIKSANSGKPITDAANTIASTKPDEQTIVGGYNEYVAQAVSDDEKTGIAAGVLSDPNSGNTNKADIIKNNGGYIYIATTENDENTHTIIEKIKIVKADPAEEMSNVAEVMLFDGKNSDLTQTCVEIYLKDNMLTAIMNESAHQTVSGVLYNEKSTVAITYDISDPTAPVEIRRHVQDGEYITSGLYGNNLRLVTKKSIPDFSKNAEIDKNNVIPSFKVNGKSTQLSAEEIFIAVNDPDASYLFITVTDISDPDAEPGRLAILGAGKDIYNLTNSIVVARGFVSIEADENGLHSSLTEICRFDISGTSVKFVGSYVTKGSLESGIAIDENGGYLRAAVSDAGTHNIDMFNDKMEFNFRISGLLNGKETDSVKFIGNKVYYISEKENGDEIYVVDISDPYKPKEGKKLPTEDFLKMLSPVSDNVILVTTDSLDGSKGKYFLLDVSDVVNPVIIEERELGEGYCFPVSTDQRQAVLDTEKMIFASPVRYIDPTTEDISLIYCVFDISENKFEDIGLFRYNGEDAFKSRCIISDDVFYTVSGTSVTAFSIEEKSIITSVEISKKPE